MVHAPSLHKIILGVLRNTVDDSRFDPPRTSPVLLHSALSFLALALRTPTSEQSLSSSSSTIPSESAYGGFREDVLMGDKANGRSHLVGLLAEIVKDPELAEQKV